HTNRANSTARRHLGTLAGGLIVLGLNSLATVAHGGETLVELLLKVRQDELLRVNPPMTPPGGVPQRTPLFASLLSLSGTPYPWHRVTSTEFWIGEKPSRGDPGN